ncbi:NADPH oxidase activator 1 isoform X2 [Lissotriton helveticus]
MLSPGAPARHEEALSDCRHALAQLRNNRCIDYSQLGLKHKLCAWEVLYNIAAVHCALGQWQAAQESLEDAIRQHPGVTTSLALEDALAKVLRRLALEPIQIPQGAYFRPRKKEVELLDSKVVLGTPKLISSVIPNDGYIGFEPLRPQKPGFYEPSSETLQSPDVGYHRVLVHYYPPDSREIAVKANSLVYVLHKQDGKATVIHEGQQKLIMPTSLLELVTIPKPERRNKNNGIPMPPLKQPPTRPNQRLPTDDVAPPQRETLPRDIMMSDPSSTEDSGTIFKDLGHREAAAYSREPRMETCLVLQHSAPRQETDLSSREPRMETSLALQSSTQQERPSSREVLKEDKCVAFQSADSKEAEFLHEGASSDAQSTIVLNVHCSCRVTLQVSPNTTLPDLQFLLKEKLRCPAENMTMELSYRDPDSQELTPVSENKDLEKLWEQAVDGTATLWCKSLDASPLRGRSILYQMVALYTYPAEGPEDLQFEKGDVLDILSEVNEDWLEGHCHGKIGIFPKCFASLAE